MCPSLLFVKPCKFVSFHTGILGNSYYIRKLSNKFPEVSQPQKPQNTSENLENLMIWKLMSFLLETS